MTKSVKLPEIDDPGRHYVDDAKIVRRINNAIELAQAEKWDLAANAALKAGSLISRYDAYDKSDAYRPQIWQSQIDQILKYCARKRKEEARP